MPNSKNTNPEIQSEFKGIAIFENNGTQYPLIKGQIAIPVKDRGTVILDPSLFAKFLSDYEEGLDLFQESIYRGMSAYFKLWAQQPVSAVHSETGQFLIYSFDYLFRPSGRL